MFRLYTSLLLFVILFCIDAPHYAEDCGDVSGHTERQHYRPQNLQIQMFYTIYLPACYASSADDYPVIYLLHGSNDDDNQWLRLNLDKLLDEMINNGEIPPLIAILPFGNVIANDNEFSAWSWDQVFLNDLLPLVEDQYRIKQEQAFRAIGGISRGGFWAFNIAFRYPELFSAVGGHSAFFDLYHVPDEYNPLSLALNVPNLDTLRIFIDRGEDDFAAPGLDIMHEHLNTRNISHDYMIYPEGQHENAYWKQHIREYVMFYAANWLDMQSGRNHVLHHDVAIDEQSFEAEEGLYVLLPVVSFPSLQSNITSDRLQAIRLGLLDESLILSESTATFLTDLDIDLPPGTAVLTDKDVLNYLWANRNLFTLLPFDKLTPEYRVLYVDDIHPLDMNLSEYQFAFSSSEPNFHPERLTRFLLSGVTALTRETMTALDTHDIDWAISGISSYAQEADFFHMSNEVSIYPTCPETDGVRLSGALSFCSKEEHFELFEKLDVDIIELSGNHNNDYGYAAYRDTLKWYRDRNIATIGGGETIADARSPLIITHNGNQIAMVSCNWFGPYFALVSDDNPGAAFCDTNWLHDVLPVLAAENDLVVVTVQYLEFDQYSPTNQQRIDFSLLAEWGADVVIGTQAHFPQTFEFVSTSDRRNAFVHYGLGNLFFDQQFFAGVRFFMDQLFVYEGKLLTVDLFTGMIEDQGRPRPMNAEERENFLYIIFVQYGGW